MSLESRLASAFHAVGTDIKSLRESQGQAAGLAYLSYESRGALRSTESGTFVVESLGIFTWHQDSTEPDDDESCFATESGGWLLQCPSMDAVAYWLQPWLHGLQEQIDDNLSAQTAKTDAIPVILRGSAASSITSVATAAQASFTVSVPGAAIGRPVAVSPPNALNARLSIYGRVTAADTVTVYINNPSASTATLAAGTWEVSVL